MNAILQLVLLLLESHIQLFYSPSRSFSLLISSTSFNHSTFICLFFFYFSRFESGINSSLSRTFSHLLIPELLYTLWLNGLACKLSLDQFLDHGIGFYMFPNGKGSIVIVFGFNVYSVVNCQFKSNESLRNCFLF